MSIAAVEIPEIVDDPELVFGIARPVGTRDQGLNEQLENSLKNYGYTVSPIKLSDILQDVAVDADRWTDPANEHDRIASLMDEGDALCRSQQDGAAVALLGVNEIRKLRDKFHEEHEKSRKRGATEVARHAYVIDSIKRPAEVTELRKIYGDRFILIGLQATAVERREVLANRIRVKVLNPTESERLADELIARDFRTEDDDLAQNILKTFPMSDVFVKSGADVHGEVRRLVDLLFGNPRSELPTTAEFGMQLAWTVSTRSPELGLKVGAVIMSDDHVLSMGMNHHPLKKEAPEIDQSLVTINELFLDTLEQFKNAELLSDDALARLDESGEAYVEELVSGPLAGAKLKGLTEFQPTVHAEMDALIDGLSQSADLDAATLFVTAYPCHNCAKHILAMSLNVVYLEPYPKSRTEAMYGSGVSERFVPFKGIAPRRYCALFAPAGDRKDINGVQIEWGPEEMRAAQPRVDPFLDRLGVSKREIFALEKTTTL